MKNNFDILATYQRLPIFLQNVACRYYGQRESKLRFNDLFYLKLKELMDSENWSLGEIEAYQNEKLQELIKYCYEYVPYYRDLMKRLKLTPKDIKILEDLKKLPILTKEDVRNNFDKLISENTNKQNLIFQHTSGTTAKSLHFYHGKRAIAFQWAIWWRHRKRFDVDLTNWHVNFTGKLVVPPKQTRPPYWRWNKPMHQAVINMHHIIPKKITDILSFLNNHNFEFYSGYPSIIHALAITAQEAGLVLNAPPRVIVTGAENMLDYQRKDIQDFTGSVLTDQYGFSEGCGNASQCPEFVYHEDFEFGIMECVDPSPVEKGRNKGKIICTGFASPEFPFIRYEVGDIGVWEDPNKKCKCGRESKVLVRIDGRIDDYVITPEGRRIMRFDYIFKDTKNVKESQIVQEKLGEIKVRIMRRPTYSLKDEHYISEEIIKWISPKLKVRFEYVNEIERESNGKFRAVKSLINSYK